MRRSRPAGAPSSPGVPPFRPSFWARLLALWATRLDRSGTRSDGWASLPRLTGAIVLAGLRIRLRRQNLYDTSSPAPASTASLAAAPDGRHLAARSADGGHNDLDLPDMGRAGSRFGRNVPLVRTYPQPDQALLTPSPRQVSRELLTRDRFQPATSLNLLAAAWLQFMVHDWLSHGPNQRHDPWEIELAPGDDWPERPMRIRRTRRDPTRAAGAEGPPTFANTATHWWDGSQLYGSDEATQRRVRSGEGGRLQLTPEGLLPLDAHTGVAVTGVSGNWWLGLELMHTLFTLEHNAICDRLRSEHPTWCDQELFDRARLVNTALLAKIHTVDWTPAILAHPTLQIAMRANWWGLAGERIHRLWGRASRSEWLSGIPGSPRDQFGVPYSITEEFVAVYRMHPLLRDDFVFRALGGGRLVDERDLQGVAFREARPAMERVGMRDALYSFGLMNPGAVTLHNFPRGMQRLRLADGSHVDLAAIDVLRVRERGVPRYNEFRRLMHKRPLRRFEELSDNAEWVEQMRAVYGGDLDAVDLMVGLYAEAPPPGFGFSDTAFRIFILMASRRLNSDRFFTTDFTPEVYTPEGMRWLDDNDFRTVLLRHFPDLEPPLRGTANPFAPWPLEVKAG